MICYFEFEQPTDTSFSLTDFLTKREIFNFEIIVKDTIKTCQIECAFEKFTKLIAEIKATGLVFKSKISIREQVSIRGMTCKSCINSIKNQFKTIQDVIFVEIDLEKELGVFTFYPEISIQEIIQIIEDCGFDADLVSDHDLRKSVSKPSPSPLKSINPETPKPSQVTLHIEGMTCASCVKSIESHLLKQNYIYSCSVSLTMETCQITYNPDESSLDNLIELIEEIGFEGRLGDDEETGMVEIRILGMTCASCSSSIEKRVATIEGVKSVSVSVLNQNGKIKNMIIGILKNFKP
jgi:P-type Cu+ transporter